MFFRASLLASCLAAVALAGALGCDTVEAFGRLDAGGTTGSGAAEGTGGRGTGGAQPAGTGGRVGSGGAIVGTGGAIMGTGGAPAATGGAGTGGRGTGGAGTGGRGSGGAGTGGRGSGGAGPGGRGSGGAGGPGGGQGGGGAGGSVCINCQFTIYYKPNSTGNAQEVSAEIQISAFLPVVVNRMTVKYWFTNESGSDDTNAATNDDLVFDLDRVSIGNIDIRTAMRSITSTAVTPARTNADTVVTFNFRSDRTAIEVAPLTIGFRMHRRDYQGVFMMANDYSFGANQTLATPWSRITVYVDGVLFAGTEPP
jgi:hypothetical protein